MGVTIRRVIVSCGAGLVLVMLTFLFIPCAGLFFSPSTEAQTDTAEIIYQAIAGGGPYQKDRTSATFETNGAKWTITGATAPIVNPTPTLKSWPIKGNTYEIYVISEPITDLGILPHTEPLMSASRTDVISVQGCPDEYESASFVIRSGDSDIKNVNLQMTDLKQAPKEGDVRKGQTISSDNIDVRTVKCWYQAGDSLWDVKHKMLKPELLLHDDGIVQIDSRYQVNLIRNLATLSDPDKLIPFDVPARSNKQVWMTLGIPENAIPGEYAGTITLTADHMSNRILQIKVTVLPIRLDRPKLTSSVFYLTEAYDGLVGKQFKRNFQSRLVEFKDMKAHGIYNPVIEQRRFNQTDLERLLQFKAQAGMDKNPLFYCAWPKLPKSSEQMNALLNHANQVFSYAKQKGINDTYFYCFDEIMGSDLLAARPVIEALRSTGVKTFQTGMTAEISDALGDLLDVIIYHGGFLFPKRDPSPSSIIGRIHLKGAKIWIYGYPQGGLEKPETYRRNYGVLLWKNGIDGMSTYAYQCPMYEAWDDWDSPSFRDELMVYPTVNGIIPTIQWEGYREAVDDLRYLTTLENQLKLVPDGTMKQEAMSWLSNLDPTQDPAKIRQQAIIYILRLQPVALQAPRGMRIFE